MGFWSGLLLGFGIGAAALAATLFVLKRRGFNHNHFE
jgi:hypothetical protein